MADRLLFPPTTVADMRQRGWDAPDFVYVSGDAYVDHPSFGAAVIVRTLEAAGYHVAVLAQPNWKNANDFKRFGRPNYGFLVSSGVIDSMVNHYTAAKRRRSSDVYTPGGKAAKRPDRAVNVYCRLIREAYGDIPIAIGGVEASLRRFAHYDYWDDAVRPSILVDSGADLLMFGMGERTILVTVDWMSRGAPSGNVPRCAACASSPPAAMRASIEIPSYEDCVRSKKKNTARRSSFSITSRTRSAAMPSASATAINMSFKPCRICRFPARSWINRIPCRISARGTPITTRWAAFRPLKRCSFPSRIRAAASAPCSFCAITFLQGRIVTTRSHESVVNEAKTITQMPNFKGYIHDVGGPTANFAAPPAIKQPESAPARGGSVCSPSPARIWSSITRTTSTCCAKSALCRRSKRCSCVPACAMIISWRIIPTFLRELCQYHVTSAASSSRAGHVSPKVLAVMGKPGRDDIDAFEKYRRINQELGKEQYLVPYLISSHPGSDLSAAIELAGMPARYQPSATRCRIFYPTPGTLSTCMFYTGFDPRTGKPVYIRVRRRKRPCSARCSSSAARRISISSASPASGAPRGFDRHRPRCLVPPEGVKTAHEYAQIRRERKGARNAPRVAPGRAPNRPRARAADVGKSPSAKARARHPPVVPRKRAAAVPPSGRRSAGRVKFLSVKFLFRLRPPLQAVLPRKPALARKNGSFSLQQAQKNLCRPPKSAAPSACPSPPIPACSSSQSRTPQKRRR